MYLFSQAMTAGDCWFTIAFFLWKEAGGSGLRALVKGCQGTTTGINHLDRGVDCKMQRPTLMSGGERQRCSEQPK